MRSTTWIAAIKITMTILGVMTIALVVGGMASAGYGVATDTDRIVVKEPLFTGESYDLGEIAVINSGDARGIYEVRIGYKTGQKEIKPPPEWFTFNPQTMTLDPDQHQYVTISLMIPAEAETGSYFAYVESRLAYVLVNGESIPMGVSVGTELPFRVTSPTPTPTPTVTPAPTAADTPTPVTAGTPTPTANLIMASPTPAADDSETGAAAYIVPIVVVLALVAGVWIWRKRH